MVAGKMTKLAKALLSGKSGGQDSGREKAESEASQEGSAHTEGASGASRQRQDKKQAAGPPHTSSSSSRAKSSTPSSASSSRSGRRAASDSSTGSSSNNNSGGGGAKKSGSRQQLEMDKSKVLTEKRPSITEKELTPIVLSQLQTAKRHKDDARARRRGSQQRSDVPALPPTTAAAAALPGGQISDSESCGEESRQRTAEMFMTGIQSALTASIVPGEAGQEAQCSEDIIKEVDNVLVKLMASLKKGDTSVAGANPSLPGQDIIPLITHLQETLKAGARQGGPSPLLPTSPKLPQQKKEWKSDPLGSLPRPPVTEDVRQVFDEPVEAKTFDPAKLRSVAGGDQEPVAADTTPNDNDASTDGSSGSKIPWKIRASRKRQQKHLTLGLTREEFANIQETLKNRPVQFSGLRPQSFALARNKSEGQILKNRSLLGQEDEAQETHQPEEPEDGPEAGSDELGYVSDVCDYNVKPGEQQQAAAKETGIIHGKLSLSIAPELGSIKVDGQTKVFQKDDSYVHPHAKSGGGHLVSSPVKPQSPSLEHSLADRRQALIQQRASVFQQCTANNSSSSSPAANVGLASAAHHDFETHAINNPAYIPRRRSSSHTSTSSSRSSPGGRQAGGGTKSVSVLQTAQSEAGAEGGGALAAADRPPDQQQQQPANLNTFNIVKPFPAQGSAKAEEDQEDSQLSRQSSVEEKSDSIRQRRKSSGGKGSTIKSKIQRRKMIKEANKRELPAGVLSDPDNEQDQDSVEEKQDSESIHDEENVNSKKKANNNNSTGLAQGVSMSELTPETARRMKDWNSRFSNLKSSFDGPSEEESSKSRSPSMQPIDVVDLEEHRGRSRFKEKGTTGPRSKSAHNVRTNQQNPQIVIDRISATAQERNQSYGPSDRPQSKEDKNKNNTLIASSSSSSKAPPNKAKDKSPVSAKRIDEDDEYLQYLNSVDRYRKNNPMPKMPIRPTTARTDAIANPLKKDGSFRQHSFSTPTQPSQAKSKQTTPIRDNSVLGPRISRSVPKEVTKTKVPKNEESQAEILGLVRTNKETGQVERTNDMDYEDYMNIINKVRKTKEVTRVRTEQIRLASMYAQEKKRQEEIRQEEERLKREQRKIEEEQRNAIPMITTVANLLSQESNNSNLEETFEKGQLDNNEQEQQMKISPRISPTMANSQKINPLPSSKASHNDLEVEVNKTEISNSNDKLLNVTDDKISIEKEKALHEQIQSESLEIEKIREEKKKHAEKIQDQARLEQLRIEEIRNEQIRQQRLREEQVQEEQRRLEKLKEEQIKQEKEREEIQKLEVERLKQIREDQKRLEEEKHRQEEQIRLEQMRLEEERKKQEQLQFERQAQYQKQQEEMEAKARAEEQKQLQIELLKIEQARQNSMSPHEKLIQERMRQQERLREEQLKEEAQIRQEKLNLIRQEEMLLTRQEEMLNQIQEEKVKLLKQEEMIRLRQQERLKQVRSEKALLEQQERMIKLREEQLLQERKRQENLREEAVRLKKQEEEIRRRQEEIAKELMQGDMNMPHVDEVMMCQAREGQVFVGRKPFYSETMLDPNIVHVQPLTSDWSSSDAETLMTSNLPSLQKVINETQIASPSVPNSYMAPNENFDASPFVTLSENHDEEQEEEWTGSTEEEDTLDEDGCYECKVEVKQQNTSVPTSVRTIETVIDVPGWAPVTPYLNVVKSAPSSSNEEVTSVTHKTAGIITSPESIITSANLMTTPESSVSLQSQLSVNDDISVGSSSWPCSPIPPVPPPPKDSKDLMSESFQTVQPDVPPRDDSFAIAAVYSSGTTPVKSEPASTAQSIQRRSLIEELPRPNNADPQLSPRLGGPGSAFKPYASNENLYDPTLFPQKQTDLSTGKPPIANGTQKVTSDKGFKRYSNSSLKPPRISESDEDFFKPKQKFIKAQMMSTTDTEPEMREFNLGPIGGDKKSKKPQKPMYSTSETEEEYQAYLKSKPKWHSKGGHKGSWDPLQIASPPQIVQRPVGVVQKPKPQAQIPQQKIERGAQVYPVSLQIYPGQIDQVQNSTDFKLSPKQLSTENDKADSHNDMNFLVPPNFERIQKSDSIIELREKQGMVPNSERIQKSSSVVEIKPLNSNKIKAEQSNSEITCSNMTATSLHSKDQASLADTHETVLQNSSQKNTVSDVNNTFQTALSPTKMNYSSPFKKLDQTDSLQVPSLTSPNESEDQTTPQAPRKFYMPKQTSVDSTNSFSEPEESNENQAPQLKSTKEDPEIKKKKEMHKNLMTEALKKVELKNNQQKKFSQISRTNPTIAALGYMTRKEIKMEEMEKEHEEEKRSRNSSGNAVKDESKVPVRNSTVDPSVLQSFRQQIIHKTATNTSQNSASRQAAIQAKKAGTPVKPDNVPKASDNRRSSKESLMDVPYQEPIVILKRQPRILEMEEIKARQSNEKVKTETIIPKSNNDVKPIQLQSASNSNKMKSPEINKKNSIAIESELSQSRQSEISSSPISVQGVKQLNTSSVPSEHSEVKKKTDVTNVKMAPPASSTEKRKQDATSTPSAHEKVNTSKAIQKVNAAQQSQQNFQKSSVSKSSILGMVTVSPKPQKDIKQHEEIAENSQKITSMAEANIEISSVSNHSKQQIESNNKVLDQKTDPEVIKTNLFEKDEEGAVKKAAEKFEAELIDIKRATTESSVSAVSFSTNIRGRSKSIGNALLEQLKDDQDPAKYVVKSGLPWAGKSPPVIKRRDMMRNKGYALQMSKSSDSITAAKMLAKARAEGQEIAGGLRINQNFSKSIEHQLDVYSKTKEEIIKILSLAKSGSVNDRIKMFTNLKDREPEEIDHESKADAIRREIQEAKAAQSQETVSDTEIEIQAPVESKVKPLKIPMKSKLLGKTDKKAPGSPGTGLRINQAGNDAKRERRGSIEELPCVKSKIKDYLTATEDMVANSKEEPPKEILPKPILVKKKSLPDLLAREQQQQSVNRVAGEARRESRKKSPKLISEHQLSAGPLQIYAQSATDMSATEDEAEQRGRKAVGARDPGPNFLKVPTTKAPDARPGIIKSKSFASTGQFESSMEDTAVSSKRQTMMAFFGAGQQQPGGQRKSVKIRERRASITSITDDILGEDEDLVNVDEEFESLLHSTFESEKRRVTSASGPLSTSLSGRPAKPEKAALGGASTGGRAVMAADSARHVGQQKLAGRLQKSQSFGSGGGGGAAILPPALADRIHGEVRSRSCSVDKSDGTASPLLSKQLSFDPVAALPTSQSKHYGGRHGLGSPQHRTPSPTQSEYDTCDPWDDY